MGVVEYEIETGVIMSVPSDKASFVLSESWRTRFAVACSSQLLSSNYHESVSHKPERIATIPLICSSLSASDLSLPPSQTGCHLLNPTHNTSVISASYSAEQVRGNLGRSASGGKFSGEWQRQLSGQDTFPDLNQNICKLALKVPFI